MTTVEFNEENLSKEQIEQLENIVKESKKKKVWAPEEGECVFYIEQYRIFGRAYTNKSFDDNDLAGKISRSLYERGQLFKTYEQAYFYCEQQKVEFEIKQYAESHNDDDIDWSVESSSKKYFIRLDFELKELVIDYFRTMIVQGAAFFASRKDLEGCIKQVGEDRIKKYIFGVEE